ncbi:hypothetical protein J6A31_06055 [bacterium]|nr:hypothetical protein [bacterium]
MYSLGETSVFGYVGAKIIYDKEPIDVVLKNSNGDEYDAESADVYEHNADEKTITILVDTDEMCKWFVQFNKKTNSSISYAFVNKMSPTLYIMNTKIITEDGKNYVTFAPVQKTNLSACRYTISLKSNSRDLKLNTGDAEMNKTAMIEFNPPLDAYNNEIFTVTVKLVTPDGQVAIGECQIQLSEQ